MGAAPHGKRRQLEAARAEANYELVQADSSAAQPPQSVPDAPPAPVPAEKPKPVQPEPEAESKAGLLPWTEPEPEPKPEKKRSRAPKPTAAPKHGKASSRSGLGLWGKKPKH